MELKLTVIQLTNPICVFASQGFSVTLLPTERLLRRGADQKPMWHLDIIFRVLTRSVYSPLWTTVVVFKKFILSGSRYEQESELVKHKVACLHYKQQHRNIRSFYCKYT